ncbi:hypothetical protein N7488_007313 [Penicillium malachiteum]|nr:hypothetical protein N7488_007313 [Penicillium malachiteum]
MDAVHVLSQQQQDTNHKLDQMDSMMREMASAITHHKAQPILDPTSLRSILEAKKQLKIARPHLSYLPYDDASLAAQNQSPSRCGCRNQNSSRRMAQTRHELECPLYQPTTRVASFGIQWAVLDKISSFSVRSFFGSTRGAGGFSISPNLQVHPEVAPSSPSFDLLVKYLDIGCSTSLPKFKKSLEELFKKGEASPRDTLPTGETLLHVSYTTPMGTT